MVEQIIIQTNKQREAELRQYYRKGWEEGREDFKQYIREELELLSKLKQKI